MHRQTTQQPNFSEHFTLPVGDNSVSCDLERRTNPAGETCYALSVRNDRSPLGDFKLIPDGSGRYYFIGEVPDYLKSAEPIMNRIIAHDA
jgi:hypothetical protein